MTLFPARARAAPQARQPLSERFSLNGAFSAFLSGVSPVAASRRATMRRAKPLAAEELSGDALLEAVAAEVHDLAADVIAVASALNACLERPAAWSLGATRNFLPRPSIAAQLVSLAARQTDELSRIAGPTARLLSSMEAAVRGIELLLEEIERGDNAALATLLHQHCRQWRALAGTMLALIEQLEPETRWRLTGGYTENSLVLARALRQVMSGLAPAVGANEQLARPALPQYRSAPRFRLETSCVVHRAGKSGRGRTVDVSTGGIGLTNLPWLALRDRIEIEVEVTGRTWRRLEGTVVWNKDTRVGVQLNELLRDDDPLLRGL